MSDFSISSAGWEHILSVASHQVEHVVEEVLEDAQTNVPRDSNKLAESLDKQYTKGDLEGHVIVGTDHWAPVEYGSRPHTIRIKNKKVLANKKTGEIFGTEVEHPGNAPQPYMRPALFKKRQLRKDI